MPVSIVFFGLLSESGITVFMIFLGICHPWVLICLNSSHRFYSEDTRNTQVYNSNSFISCTNICCELYVAIKKYVWNKLREESFICALSFRGSHRVSQWEDKQWSSRSVWQLLLVTDKTQTCSACMTSPCPHPHTHAVIFRLHIT